MSAETLPCARHTVLGHLVNMGMRPLGLCPHELIAWQRLLATNNLNVVSPGTLTSTCMKLQPLGACSPHWHREATAVVCGPSGYQWLCSEQIPVFWQDRSLGWERNSWESLHSIQPSSHEGYRDWIGLYWLNICNRKHLKPDSTFWFADTYGLDSVVRGESGNDQAALP